MSAADDDVLWHDVGPWHCGLCGQDTEGCECGEPLLLIVRVPGLTPTETDHDLAAMSLLAMLNDQRVENYEGPEGYGPAPIRLLASGWNDPAPSHEETRSPGGADESGSRDGECQWCGAVSGHHDSRSQHMSHCPEVTGQEPNPDWVPRGTTLDDWRRLRDVVTDALWIHDEGAGWNMSVEARADYEAKAVAVLRAIHMAAPPHEETR